MRARAAYDSCVNFIVIAPPSPSLSLSRTRVPLWHAWTSPRRMYERANGGVNPREGGTGVISWWRTLTFSRDQAEDVRLIVLPRVFRFFLLFLLSLERIKRALLPICGGTIWRWSTSMRNRTYDRNFDKLYFTSLTNLFNTNPILAKINNATILYVRLSY